jgi:Spy/CpxP family protein refolding chaperone
MSENATPVVPSFNPSDRSPRCHRRGGALFLGVLGLAMAGVLAFGAFRALGIGTRHGGFCPHGSLTPGQVEQKIDRLTTWVMDDLDGTPEQRQKAAEVAKAATRDLAPIHEELLANHEKVVAVLTAPTIDRAALEALRARQMALAETASKRITRAVADLGDALTPDQRVELVERVREFHHR